VRGGVEGTVVEDRLDDMIEITDRDCRRPPDESRGLSNLRVPGRADRLVIWFELDRWKPHSC